MHNERTVVPDLDIELYVNLEFAEKMRFNAETKLYESTIRPKIGEKISLQTTFKEVQVKASDRIPKHVMIESISAERQGPIHIYSENDYLFTYRITFSDNPEEENFYFLQYDVVNRQYDVDMGERDFTYDFGFQQLARQVNGILPGWEPYSPYGLPFSDRGIEGKTHTLVVKEKIQGEFNPLTKFTQMNREFKLYAISKPYYEYLVSLLCNRSEDGGIHGGMIDIGVADPIKIYSNIEGEIGVFCSYVVEPEVIDIFSFTGAFPK
ncbi:MAG: DUF4249 domain-containing protein [Tannerellaceae bacterium]|nr:DUF4249 domain-containing protein [Tannerellaceae bacterium]